MIKAPTTEEIYQASREIERAGERGDHDTVVISVALADNEILNNAVQAMSKTFSAALHIERERGLLMYTLVQGALATGLQYGLHIGEARLRIAAGRKPNGVPS